MGPSKKGKRKLHIKRQGMDDALLITTEGILDEITTPGFESSMEKHLDCKKRIILDLSGVKQMSIEGIMCIARLKEAVKLNGGVMDIAGARC